MKTATRPKSSKKVHFIDILEKDHRKVEDLFAKYEKAKDDDRKKALADEIVLELKVHAQVEEEIVYPVLRQIIEEDLMDEADVEHHVAKGLIAEIESMNPGDDHYDARVTVLGEVIEHHVEEEEEDIFPKARKIKDESIAERLVARKAELMEELAGE